MNDVLTFNEEKHIYHLNDRLIPNVTSIIQSINLVDFSFVNKKKLEEGQYRGTAVHETVRLYNKKTLDLKKLSPKWTGFLSAYINFMEDTGAEVVQYETKVYSKKYMYAGTLDIIVLINGKLHIIDFKTGVINEKYCRLQTSAYENCHREMTGERKAIKRHSLKLNEDGTYKLSKEYKDKNDHRYFLSALQIYNFKNAA